MRELLSKITVPFHACVRLGGSVTVYTDPYGLKIAPHDGDLVLVTHSHYDHLSPEDLARVCTPDTVLVLPAGDREKGEAAGFMGDKLITLTAGEKVQVKGVTVEAVAAYNLGKDFHPKKNGWLGYIVTLDGVRYYIAGDTDDTSDARNVLCDVALVPVGGTYTMDAEQAAELVNAIRPKAAVPIHYGLVAGSEADADKFISLLAPGIYGEKKMQ